MTGTIIVADALRAKVESPESGVAYETFVSAMQIVIVERDALRAENANLQDDLASVERERAHQHGRADRNAAEYAREQKKREQLQAENARLRELVAYLAGTNTDHVQVALAGNPIACDAIHAEACALLGETQ